MKIAENLITQHLDVWTSANKERSTVGRGSRKKLELYGVAKLRELILDLAVRGMLLEQDPDDETAEELLSSITNERARLIKERKIKNQKCILNNDTWSGTRIPTSWQLTTLGNIADWGSGSTPKKENANHYGGELTWLKSGELNDCQELKGSSEKITEAAVKAGSFRKNRTGDVLIAMYGATIGKAAILSESAYTNQAVCGCTPFNGIFNKYLFLFLLSQRKNFHAASEGGAQPNISKVKLLGYPFPLPPLAEQHRIVSKVDELMALCDQLEEEQENNFETHNILVSTLLYALTSAPSDPSQFAETWQRIQDNFGILFTTENSIDQLKKAILQLAVMGKLVAQDPEDEPVEILLSRIASKKEKMIREKIIPKQKPLPEICEAEKNVAIPQSWNYTKIDDLCGWITSGSTPPKSDFTKEEKIPYLKVYNIREQRIDFDYQPQFITEASHNKLLKRSILRPGDVVMNIVGPPLGKTAIIPNTFPEWNCNQAITCFRLIEPELNSFIHLFLKSGTFLNNIELVGTAGQDNISVTKSRNIVIPLPPLSEQHRIVAKVDEMMLLCDKLKAKLAQAKETQLNLAESIVKRATQ